MSSDEEAPHTPSSDDEQLNNDEEKKPSGDNEKTELELKLPKSETHFAFGPGTWYWIRCGNRWRFVRSKNSDWSELNIHDASWVAFKHNTGFMVGGVDVDGEARIVHTWNNKYMIPADEVDAFVTSRDAYMRLHDWICDQCNNDIEKVRDVSVSIGPKGSYFARCRSSWTSHALPKDLRSCLDKYKDESYPVTIALGIRGAWIVLWSDGTRSWNLRYAYPTLASSGNLSNKENRVVFAALNPYNEDGFALELEDGAIVYRANLESNKESNSVHEITHDYLQYRAKRDGTSFTHPLILGSTTKQIRITPDSYQESGRIASLISSWKERRTLPMQGDMAFVGAVAVGAGALSKVAGLSTVRAAGLAASSGLGAALAMLYRS